MYAIIQQRGYEFRQSTKFSYFAKEQRKPIIDNERQKETKSSKSNTK